MKNLSRVYSERKDKFKIAHKGLRDLGNDYAPKNNIKIYEIEK